jgi:hypothetical protein
MSTAATATLGFAMVVHQNDPFCRTQLGADERLQGGQLGGSIRVPHEGWPHSVTAGALPPGSRNVVRPIDAGDGTRGQCGQPREGLPGRDAERSGMGPAVVLGQDLIEAAGPVRHGALADPATGDRRLGDGHGEAAGRGLAHMPQ